MKRSICLSAILWVCAAVLSSVTAQAQLTVTNNLRLWLKADALSLSDGSPVSSWTDSSINGNNAANATASLQPTFVAGVMNGLPVVRFDGVNDFLGFTRISLPSELTFVAVFRTTSADATSGYPGNAALNIIGDHTGNIGIGFGVHGGKGRFNAFDGCCFGWKFATGTTTVNDGSSHDLIATFRTNDPATLYVQGLSEATATAGYRPGNGVDRISGGYLDDVGTADVFDGDLAEILIYDSVLSASDRQQVHEYLVAKYALPEPSTAFLLGLGGVLLLRRRPPRK